jgi:hypothetical protein
MNSDILLGSGWAYLNATAALPSRYANGSKGRGSIRHGSAPIVGPGLVEQTNHPPPSGAAHCFECRGESLSTNQKARTVGDLLGCFHHHNTAKAPQIRAKP